jgi:phage tail sheath gpL-like
VTSNGAGPWLGVITLVNADGTADLLVDVPGDTVTTADGSDAATTQALANALKAQINAQRKVGLAEGSTGGTFSLATTEAP